MSEQTDKAKTAILEGLCPTEEVLELQKLAIEETMLRKQLKTFTEETLDLSKLISPDDYRKSVNRAVCNFITKNYERLLQDKYEKGELTDTTPEGQVVLDHLRTMDGIKKATCFSITVRPAKVTDVHAFMDKTHKVARSKGIKKSVYCIETATDDGTCEGHHIHMVVDYETPMYATAIRQRIQNAYKTFAPCMIKVMAMKDEKYRANAEAYIGKLPDENDVSNSKHTDDIVFRQQNNFEHRYEYEL